MLAHPHARTPPKVSISHPRGTNPLDILKKIKTSNLNRLVIGQININSIRNKFEPLNLIIKDNLDILVITESKLDESFPSMQFAIGGVAIYVREDIPCRELTNHLKINNPADFEGIFLEINLRKAKWLLFGGYNNKKSNVSNFLENLGPMLDHHMVKYDNVLLVGDFNLETHEMRMNEFCDVYSLRNLFTEPTCYKNPLNPSSIDLMLTNKIRSFLNSQVIETGLSDHHKMTITVLSFFYYQKQAPISIIYRDYNKFDNFKFHSQLNQKFEHLNRNNITYDVFESTLMEQLNIHAPMKEKIIRANNAPFMNKTLSKAFMTRSRLRNRFLKNPNKNNEVKFKQHCNFCINLLKREKSKYYNSLDLKKITDNRQFWKTIKPLFSEKQNISRRITLIDGDNIISNDADVAKAMNICFSNAINNLEIKGYHGIDENITNLDPVHNAEISFKITRVF